MYTSVPERLLLPADCLSTRMALPMNRMLSAVSFEMYGGSASRTTCISIVPLSHHSSQVLHILPYSEVQMPHHDAIIHEPALNREPYAQDCTARRGLCRLWPPAITDKGRVPPHPKAQCRMHFAHLEALLPLQGAGLVICGGCMADVLFWLRWLDEKVLLSSQQHPVHHPEAKQTNAMSLRAQELGTDLL